MAALEAGAMPYAEGLIAANAARVTPALYAELSAVLGDASLYAHYGNYTFHFSSEENRALFLAAPYEYVPQFVPVHVASQQSPPS